MLVRVEATGVSFAEQQMRRGKYYDQPPFPFVPGYDLVGTVQATGEGVDPARVGERVAAVVKTGAWATHVLVDAGAPVPVPDGVDPAEAETVVVNGITAWQMLHRIARVRRGQTIVVLGANGGVGSTLVQLAADAGITVIGTASARHHDARPEPRCDARRLPRPGPGRPAARTGTRRRRRGVRPRRRSRHRGLLAAAAPRRHARLLRHRGDEGRRRQVPAPRPRARRPPAALERPAERPARALLQLLGRPPTPRAVPPASARGPDRRCSTASPPARSPHRSPHGSRSPRPAAPWPSRSPTRSRARWCCSPDVTWVERARGRN